jgi:hypothetical protein
MAVSNIAKKYKIPRNWLPKKLWLLHGNKIFTIRDHGHLQVVSRSYHLRVEKLLGEEKEKARTYLKEYTKSENMLLQYDKVVKDVEDEQKSHKLLEKEFGKVNRRIIGACIPS